LINSLFQMFVKMTGKIILHGFVLFIHLTDYWAPVVAQEWIKGWRAQSETRVPFLR
jgi:hypothetical protein